jgi:diguanylate cyclase (GGDEF)-like protein
MILLDVDNFKGVNDTLGHAYGDEVLAKIGGSLRAIFSTEDYVGRIGGDEFCVFVNTEAPENMDYTDFIRTKCEMISAAFREHYTGADGTYKISGSIGCAFFVKDGEDFQALYHAADQALYASKHRGKDTYTIAGEEGDDPA